LYVNKIWQKLDSHKNNLFAKDDQVYSPGFSSDKQLAKLLSHLWLLFSQLMVW